ncbi:DMT family transporter [Alicyclobacillus sp. TC]|uniref:DMT family transporter n=1 Tax=Alicyclobacillus sp. TC TaxID=2606450 RepID=UPI0019315E7D|nr:DMT family transporter [Alicyclobacillus sp. TC]QRF22847.1 DMT family transporter [Alicyclobacillus sp. TC]
MRVWPLLALLMVAMMWGSHAVVGKAVEAEISPDALTLYRFVFSALLYLPWWPKLAAVWQWSVKDKLLLLGAAISSSVLYPLFYYASLRHISPVASLLFVNAAPLVAALLARWMFAERIGWMGYVGMVVSFGGVLLLVINEWQGGLSTIGIIEVVLAMLAFSIYTVLSKPLFVKANLFDVLVGTTVLGAAFLCVILPFFHPLQFYWYTLVHLGFTGWWELGYIVLIVSMTAYALYGFGLRRVPGGIAAAITFYPQAVFGALLQWLWFGLQPVIGLVFSAVLILGGTALMRYSELRSKKMEKAVVNKAQAM